MPGVGKVLTADLIKDVLDRWCRKAWDHWVGTVPMRRLPGSLKETPADWLIEALVGLDTGTILYGAPGRGKSWIGIALAVAIDAGLARTPFGPVTRAAKALYVNLERSERDIRFRLGCVNAAFGLPVERELLVLSWRGATLEDVQDAIRRAVLDGQAEVVFIDSLSRAGAGSLLADDVANDIMDTLNGLGCGWVAIAHVSKAVGENDKEVPPSPFGSQMQVAAADVTVALTSSSERTAEGILPIALTVTKINSGPRPRPWYLTLEFSGQYLKRIRRAERHEAESIAASAGEPHLIIAGCLARAGKPLTISEIVEATGLSDTTVRDALRHHQRMFVQVAQGSRGRGKAATWALRAYSYEDHTLQPSRDEEEWE
jgi:hypothetical protein